MAVAGCLAGGIPNIYLSSVNVNNNNGSMLLKIDSYQSDHKVAIVKNVSADNNDDKQWKPQGCFDTYQNSFIYQMPDNLTRKKYYAFRLDEGNNYYYTKRVYLASNGQWMDCESEGDAIQRDKNTNGVASLVVESMLPYAMYMLATKFLML
ncbi:hypothetical protein PAPHI01_0089 [Pancytospora philotis]|nr:hypothetical protein PAPHI01_0089 [Pancytospora philotis]